MGEMMIFWLALLVVSIVVEVLTMGLTSIWFAGGALAAILVTLLGGPIWLQILLAFAVSLLLLIFTRPIAVRYFNKERVKTNVESLVGQKAMVISRISNLQSVGQVIVGGQEWRAQSQDDQEIEDGAVVEIIAVSGVKLIVRKTADGQPKNAEAQSAGTQSTEE